MTCCTCEHVQQQLQLQSNARRLRCAGYDAQANLQLYLHVTVQVSGLRVACTGLHRQVCMYRCACTGLYVQVCVYRSQVCMLYCSATCRPEWACEHHHLLSVQIPSQWSCSACCHQTTSCTGSCCTSDSHEPIHNHAALPQPATKAVTTVRCETDSIHAGHLVACLKQAYTYAVQL